MGCLLDSSQVAATTISAYSAKATEFLSAMGTNVDIWEVGNEINGDWLGSTSDVVAKMSASFDLVKAKGFKTALTFYVTEPYGTDAAHELLTWINANVPARMKTGLEYVLLSYYEDDNHGYQPDWLALANAVGLIFPNSLMGVGECGTLKTTAKEAMVNLYYKRTVNHPRWINGNFWWYFDWNSSSAGDMVPYTNPLWAVLNTAITGTLTTAPTTTTTTTPTTTTTTPTTTTTTTTKTKGIRLDPGYLYDDYPGQTASYIATKVVAEVLKAGFNTIYLFAYSPTYGAFYTTSYTMTAVEGDLGAANFTALLIAAASASGIKVIAGFPVNNFKQVWDAQSAWRVKKKSGVDYINADYYPLSSHHISYQNWYTGLLNDFMTRNPTVYGLESVEGMVDLFWDGSVDYNSVAQSAYFAKYPTGTLGDANWKLFRSAAMSNMHSLLCTAAHAKGKKAHVVNTWTASSNGSLYNSSDISAGMGFDFDGVMNLAAPGKPDAMIAELMWQQWAAEYGTTVFTPSWTTTAATAFKAKVASRTEAQIHIEISPFSGSAKSVTPTVSEFNASLSAAIATGLSYDIYDFHLLRTRGILATMVVS